MSACPTCQDLRTVIQDKDEEIRKLQATAASAERSAQLERDNEIILNRVRECSIEIEKLNSIIDAEKSKAVQKEHELSAKIKELEKHLVQSSGKASGDLDRILSQIVYKDNRILELNNTILDKERQILDLQEMCHEQGQVAQAKNQAMQIVHQKIIAYESRKTCDAGTETDFSLLPRSPKPTRSTSPGRAIAQIKFGVRSSPPPLDPSEDMSSFTTEQNGLEENEEEPGTSKVYRSKKNRKKVTFDLPPSVGSSTVNLQTEANANAMLVADLGAENDELRRVISDMENIEFEKYKKQIAKLEEDLQAAKHDGRNQVLKARAAAQGRIKDMEERIASMQEQYFDETEQLRTRIEKLTEDREWALLEKARLQDEVDACKMKLHDLHEKFRENEETTFELNNRLAQEAQFSERLADDVQEAQFTANQLLEQKQMILDDVERLKEALFAQDELIGVLEADITIYEEHIGILRESLGASKKENYQIIKSKAFETKLRALEKEKDQMDKRNNDERLRTKALNKKVKTLQTENDVLRKKLREAEVALEVSVGSLRTHHHEEPLQPASSAEGLKTAVEEVDNTRQNLLEGVDSGRCDNVDLQTDYARLKENNDILSREIAQLRERVAAAESAKNCEPSLVSKEAAVHNAQKVDNDEPENAHMLDKLRALASTFGNQHLSVDAVLERVRLLEQKLAESTDNIGKVKRRIQSVLEENVELKKEIIRKESDSSAQRMADAELLEQMRSTITELRAENFDLRESLTSARSVRKDDYPPLPDQAQMKTMEQEMAELQRQLCQWEETSETLTQEALQTSAPPQEINTIQELQSNIVLLEEELNQLQSERVAKEEKLKEREQEIEEKLVEKEELIVSLQSTIGGLLHENNSLKDEIQSSEEALEDMRKKLEDNHSQERAQTIVYLQDQLEAVLKENAALVEERTMDEETLEALRRELVEANTDCEKLRIVNELLQSQKCEIENELEVVRSEFASLASEQKSDASKITSLKDYVEELTAKLSEAETAKTHIEELQSDVHNLMSEVVTLREENEELLRRPTRTECASSSQEREEVPMDASELFGGETAELTKTASGCLLLENQLLRDCVSETNRMHDDLTSDVNQMMILNQELENAVDALKGEIWSLNNRLKACFVEREELIGKLDSSFETERAYRDLQKAYNALISKKTCDRGTDPMEASTVDDKTPYNDLLASLGEELKKLRDSDLHVVREDLGHITVAFSEMQSSVKSLLQKILEESAAKLTTKQADNDALFRANSEIAHANVALQNQIEELHEKLEEAREMNDRFISDGNQTAEEKIAQFKNTIRSLEDRLELTENLNKELEDKCYEAEQREKVVEEEIRCLELRVAELTKAKEEVAETGGWDDWNADQSDSEETKPSVPGPESHAGKCSLCVLKDNELSALRDDVQDKEQEIAFLKERTCPRCVEKDEELIEMSLNVTQKSEEIASLNEEWSKRLELERLDCGRQLAECSAKQNAVESGWDDWNECEKCAEKDASLKQMSGVLAQMEKQIADDEKPCGHCAEKEESLSELSLLLTQRSEQIAELMQRCEDYQEKFNHLAEEREAKANKTQEGWDDWNEECQNCVDKERMLEAVNEKLNEKNEEIEILKDSLAEKVAQLQETCPACVEKEETLCTLAVQIAKSKEEMKAVKESYEQKRVNYEERIEEFQKNTEGVSAQEDGWGEWNECSTCSEKDLAIQRLADTLKDKQDAIEFLDHEVTRLRALSKEPCSQCNRKDKNIADLSAKLKAATDGIAFLKNAQSNPETEGSNDWSDFNVAGSSFKLKDAHAELRTVQKQIETLRKIAASEITSMALHFQNALQTLATMHANKEKSTKQTLLTWKKKMLSLKKQNELLKDSECRLTDSTDTYARQLEELQETYGNLKKLLAEKDTLLETEKREKVLMDEATRSLKTTANKAAQEIRELQEAVAQKEMTIEQLKQSALSEAPNASSKDNEDKLIEMELQRDEANRKVLELQRKLRSIQDKRRLSVSSKLSNSTSSQFAVNEISEPDTLLSQDLAISKPVMTNTISATPAPARHYSEVSGGDDPIRRRVKK